MGLFDKLFKKNEDELERNVVVEYDDDEEEYDEGEGLSVWDAADIYRCSGEDEDYMFGYTHEELTDAY